MSEEHRQQARVPIAFEVTLESDHNFYSGITGNVSTGGVFVATYTPPPSGAEVELDLHLEGETFRLKGVVCWVRESTKATQDSPAGCGIRWTVLPAGAAKAIGHFVDKRDTIFFDDE